jgi:hypothetical protein
LFSQMPQPVHFSSLIIGRFLSSPTMAWQEHCSLHNKRVFRKKVLNLGDEGIIMSNQVEIFNGLSYFIPERKC